MVDCDKDNVAPWVDFSDFLGKREPVELAVELHIQVIKAQIGWGCVQVRKKFHGVLGLTDDFSIGMVNEQIFLDGTFQNIQLRL